MKKHLFSLFLILFFLILQACESYPNDPENSHEEARGDTLRVGVIEAPPWIVFENGEISGVEAEIIKGFAKEIDAEVEWVKGTEEELMPLLEEFELHLVAGGITSSTPWKKHIGLTGTYKKEKVFICNTTGELVPEEIEGKKVGVKKGTAVGAYVKKKKGIPVFLDSLESYKGLIAVYEHEKEKFGCQGSSLTIKTEKHVLAVPRGENNLLMTLEEFLNEAGY